MKPHREDHAKYTWEEYKTLCSLIIWLLESRLVRSCLSKHLRSWSCWIFNRVFGSCIILQLWGGYREDYCRISYRISLLSEYDYCGGRVQITKLFNYTFFAESCWTWSATTKRLVYEKSRVFGQLYSMDWAMAPAKNTRLLILVLLDAYEWNSITENIWIFVYNTCMCCRCL